MKCQSDYDDENQVALRQADECVEPWWEPESRAADEGATEFENKDDLLGTVEKEALRRGLLKHDKTGDLCVSCSEGDE
jgi:hypothetical protein